MDKLQRTCGGLNPESYEAFDYAEREYKHIRSMSRDCIYISRNTNMPFEVVSIIKGYIFENQHFLSGLGLYGRFDSDFAMAQSWVRLSNRLPISIFNLTIFCCFSMSGLRFSLF